MKKIVLLVALIATTAIQAQQARENQQENKDISILVNQSESYGLSPTQREKLIARKKTIGREYAAIGRDRSLSGYEKGVKKRALSIQIQEDIRAILNEEQYGQWSSYQQKNDHYTKRYSKQNEEIENQIDRLEREYEHDVKKLEQEYRNDKYTLKREKNKRKSRYKTERQKLKDQRI